MPKRKEKGGSSTIAAKKGRKGPVGSDSGCSTSSHLDKDNSTLSEEPVDDEFDLYPGLGSRKRLDDLFNSKKNGSSQLSNEDLLKAEEDMRKFLGGGSSTTKQKDKKCALKSSRKEKKEKKDRDEQDKKNGDLDPFGTDDLLREAKELLAPRTVVHATTSSSPSLSPKENADKSTGSKRLIVVEEIVISDTEIPPEKSIVRKGKIAKGKRNQRSKKPKKTQKKDDTSPSIEVQEISDDENEVDLGHILFFQAELKSDKFPIRMYEKQYVRELRAMVAEKAKSPVETLQMFLGDCVQLEDDKTLAESGIESLSVVEIFLIYKSEKELYEDGSASVFKFKLQTEDRRGRQDAYVFVSRSGKMQSAIEQYASELGISSSGMKLHFDGEEINLSLTPEECDLEGGECLDLQVSAS